MAGWAAGVFTRARNWVTDKANVVNPQASLFDQEDDNFASGLNNCVTKDGLNKPSATMDWNNQRLSNLGAATARPDALQAAQFQDGTPLSLSAVAGTDTITGTLTPTITAYANLMRVSFIPAATNTGAATLNISAIAARSIVDERGTALVAGAIVSGVPASVIYDLANTRWVLQSSAKVADAELSSNVPLKNASNTFTGVTQTISAGAGVRASLWINGNNLGATAGLSLFSDIDSNAYVFQAANAVLNFYTNSTLALQITAAGNFDFQDGTVSTTGLTSAEVGTVGTVQNVQNGDYTLALTDRGKSIDKQSGGSGETITIPANASVAFPIGTIICGDNDGGGTLTIAITTDTLEDTGGNTGSRTVADNGFWSIKKIAATKWRITGSGIS